MPLFCPSSSAISPTPPPSPVCLLRRLCPRWRPAVHTVPGLIRDSVDARTNQRPLCCLPTPSLAVGSVRVRGSLVGVFGHQRQGSGSSSSGWLARALLCLLILCIDQEICGVEINAPYVRIEMRRNNRKSDISCCFV